MPEEMNTDTASVLDTEAEIKTEAEEPKNVAEEKETETPSTEEAETKVEEKVEEDKKSEEPELTIDSYGDLGLKETDDVKIDADVQKEFKEAFLKHKVSPDAAKELAALQVMAVQKEAKRQEEVYNKLIKGWEEQNIKTYGDDLKNVQTNCGRVLAQLDKTGQFKELLTLAGADKAPATLAFLKAVGDVLLEKPSINGNASGPTKEPELEDFYK